MNASLHDSSKRQLNYMTRMRRMVHVVLTEDLGAYEYG